jgi:hypothetical protein
MLEKQLEELNRRAGGQAPTGVRELDEPRQRIKKQIQELKRSR